MEVVDLARDSLNPELELLGVVLNIANMRTKHARQTLEALRERFGDKVCRAVIRQSIAYAESAERAVPILDYRPDRGADYLSLAGELLRRLRAAELLAKLDELSGRARSRGRIPVGDGGPARAGRRARAVAGARRARGGGLREALGRRAGAPPGSRGAPGGVRPALPESGSGAPEAIAELAARGREAATRSSGPRFFHFVMGGTTPAALGADWLTSAYDQVAFGWASSPLGSRLEGVAVALAARAVRAARRVRRRAVTGATMANFAGLAAARSWWAERLRLRRRRGRARRRPPAA